MSGDWRMTVADFEQKCKNSMEIMPWIKFPSDWEVQLIQPFAAAVARFRVRKGNACVSVYADFFDNIGCFGEPYWEVYPHHEDVGRCKIADVPELLKMIRTSIRQQNKSQKD